MPSERRRLEELVTLYDVEPGITGDIYVEGSFDKRFFEWILHSVGSTSLSIYEIDSVDVPDDILEDFELPTGSNRSRVIALARTLSNNVPSVKDRVAFVIDKDLDDYLGSSWSFPSLFRTDYTSLDVYLFAEPVMEKFLYFAIRTSGLSVTTFMSALETALTELFTIRLTSASLAMNASWVRIQPSCSITTDGYIHFDRDDYLDRYLRSGGRLARLEEFKREMERLREGLLPDPRLRMHGHDLKDILYYFSQQSAGSRVFTSSNSLEAALLMTLSTEGLIRENLITRLLRWADVSPLS